MKNNEERIFAGDFFVKVEFSDRLLFAENICVVHLKLQVDSVFVRSDQVESCCRKDR